MKKAILFLVGAALLAICACCRVSGDCAREEEKPDNKQG